MIIIKFILAILSSALLLASFPKYDYSYLAWIALVPFFAALRKNTPRAAFVLSYLTGVIFFSGIFSWIRDVKGVTLLDFAMVMSYLGLYFGLFGITYNFITERIRSLTWLAAPVLWVSLEYIRSHADFLSLPWALLGHSQYANLEFIQMASITGAYGVSFLIVLVNSLLFESLFKPRHFWKRSVAAVLVAAASFAYGSTVLRLGETGNSVQATVIQGNIEIDEWSRAELKDRIVEKQVNLTEEALKKEKPSLVIWPEGALAGSLQDDYYLWKSITGLAREKNINLLVGSSRQPKFKPKKEEERKVFNSAFLVPPKGRIRQHYSKIQLLPFAEYLPFRDRFPWPARLRDNYNITAGTRRMIFNIDGVRFGVLICWENIFAGLFREFVQSGAQFMVNMTNESWFGDTAAPYHFLSMSVFRSVENRVSVVRSANSGISCFIDPYGRIHGMVSADEKVLFVEGFLTENVRLSSAGTVYTSYGDILAYASLALSVLLAGAAMLARRPYLQ